MTATCQRKQRYASLGLAQKAAQKRSRETGDLIQGYACAECGGFHIGHPPLRGLRGRTGGRRGRG